MDSLTHSPCEWLEPAAVTLNRLVETRWLAMFFWGWNRMICSLGVKRQPRTTVPLRLTEMHIVVVWTCKGEKKEANQSSNLKHKARTGKQGWIYRCFNYPYEIVHWSTLWRYVHVKPNPNNNDNLWAAWRTFIAHQLAVSLPCSLNKAWSFLNLWVLFWSTWNESKWYHRYEALRYLQDWMISHVGRALCLHKRKAVSNIFNVFSFFLRKSKLAADMAKRPCKGIN